MDVAQEGAAIDNNYQEPDDLLPAHLVPVGDTLLAVGRTPFGTGAPLLWSTKDGSTWTALDNSSWREALATNTLISVAGGPSGVVIVATEGNICCANPQGPPVIIHSSDGVTWDRLVLSSIFEDAYPRDVTAYAGGFAIVGRVGEQQVMDPIPAVGRPAAWTSADGVTWVASQVEGAQGKGAFLYTVIAGSDGLFATRVREVRQINHTVRAGKSLASIAQLYYGDRSRSEVIWETNQLPPNPKLTPGSVLKIPEIPGLPFDRPLAPPVLTKPEVTEVGPSANPALG